MAMFNPESSYNKVPVQEWSDKFWKLHVFIWLPLVVLYKLVNRHLRKTEEKK